MDHMGKIMEPFTNGLARVDAVELSSWGARNSIPEMVGDKR